MELPLDFVQRMEEMLGDEMLAFLQSYKAEKCQGLRINTAKISVSAFLKSKKETFGCRPVPWEKRGFYYDAKSRPGKHPWHEAGLYYIQEPSAMSAAAVLAPKPGDRVLDLCAAPGGKTTQLADYMQGEGLLVANEIHPARAKILSQNVERLGIANALVTNETSGRLAEYFSEYFDKILCDAPCSGEGMFRKDELSRQEWSMEHVKMCADRQMEILNHAAGMLKKGGYMVYSTCTFSAEENEGVIAGFLQQHPEFELCSCDEVPEFSHGRREWNPYNIEVPLEYSFRLWPHQLEGEGHYVALLHKCSTVGVTGKISLEKVLTQKEKQKKLTVFTEFCKNHLYESFRGEYLLFGEQLYLVPEECPSLKGIKVLRPGLHLGTLDKKIFKPAHALSHALKKEQVKNSVDFSADSLQIQNYLKGDVIQSTGTKGWVLVCVDGIGLGWGKASNGMIKNHYPKGLRLL